MDLHNQIHFVLQVKASLDPGMALCIAHLLSSFSKAKRPTSVAQVVNEFHG